jgi:hypothetical protein
MAVIIFENDTVFCTYYFSFQKKKNSFVVGQAVVRVCEPLRPQCQVGASVQHLGFLFLLIPVLFRRKILQMPLTMHVWGILFFSLLRIILLNTCTVKIFVYSSLV